MKKSTQDNLDICWKNLMQFLHPPETQSAIIYDDLLRRYQEPQRHFHTPEHLARIFSIIKPEQYDIEDQAILIATTFWHDAVYQTHPIDIVRENETRSAELAREQLMQLGASKEFIDEVATIIVASKDHVIDSEKHRLGAIFLDADMASLADDPADYDRGTENVNKEYCDNLTREFCEKRVRFFLDPMLKKDSIYLLRENELQWGQRARDNMSREKSDLEKLLKSKKFG